MNIRSDAYEIILKVLKNKDYTDNLLHQRAKKLKAHPEQVAFLYHIVKGTVKHQLNLDYICSQFTDSVKFGKTDIKIKVLLYMGLYQLIHMDSVPDHASIHVTVELAKHLFGDSISGFVNSILRSYQRNPEIHYPKDTVLRIACEHSYPIEIIRQWINIYGEEQTELLAMFYNETPMLHIRVNRGATTPEKLIQYFEKRGITCLQSDAYTDILLCKDAVPVLEDVAFSEGYYSVQDTSAALIVNLLNPQKGESVLDLFAAPGGKCTYIAEKLYHTGEVIAVDKSPSKMKLLKQAAERLQITNIKSVVQDAFNYGPVAAAFHRVLVDVPCSGWGVFGRKADLRWQEHQNVTELLKIQEKAINYASNFVRKDGFLVYSTCTINPQENENMVQQFLKKNAEFILINASTEIPETYTDNKFLKTMPSKHHMDGAFAAKMQRIR